MPQNAKIPRSRTKTRSPGFSLIELMVGLVILMVVTSIALPMTSSLLRQAHLRNAADDLVHAADIARSRARSNRKAYGLYVGTGGLSADDLIVEVVRGSDTTCKSVIGGTVVHKFDYSKGNAKDEPQVQIVAKAPGEAGNVDSFPCFKPDGRVLRGDTETPFSPPNATTFQAGDIFYELTRVADNGTLIGNRLQVQITYSGNARITFGYNLAALK